MTLALNASYEKLTIALRYWLLGRNYFDALKALEFAARYHTGTRKDGTPEFSHQIWQANYIRTLEKSLDDPEGTLITTLCHDLLEDYPVAGETMISMFGKERGTSIIRITKIRDGIKVPDDAYYGEMAEDVRASVAKGGDRIHNHQTMQGAFTRQKQLSYMQETDDLLMPMLKVARRRFPSQELAYENIKHVLRTQMELIRCFQNPDEALA